jgi:hypothetical protein
MFETIAWQVLCNSLGVVVAISGVAIVAVWAWSEVTHIKNKVNNLR